jgi:hypothetical protein
MFGVLTLRIGTSGGQKQGDLFFFADFLFNFILEVLDIFPK